jgi:hypothetical protein
MTPSVSLEVAFGRFLDHHRALNHSQAQLSHYNATFQDFQRFLTVTKRPQHITILTTETFEAFASWLKDQPR